MLFGGCGSAHQEAASPDQSAECGKYEQWETSIGIASPKGRSSTPENAVRSLAGDSVTVGAVLDQTRWTATVNVVRQGANGVYSLRRHGRSWVVTGGDGCAASGGAPIMTEGGGCAEPDEKALDELQDGETYTAICADVPFYTESNGYYYP